MSFEKWLASLRESEDLDDLEVRRRTVMQSARRVVLEAYRARRMELRGIHVRDVTAATPEPATADPVAEQGDEKKGEGNDDEDGEEGQV